MRSHVPIEFSALGLNMTVRTNSLPFRMDI